MNKFTSGPWLIGKHGSVISDPGNNNEGNDDVINFYGGNVICESIATVENARLIAAAPELLQACINTIDSLNAFSTEVVARDMIVPMWVNDLRDYLYTVIAKAKGEQ